MIQATDNHKVQLTGSILGVESCHIATDSNEVRVGSSLDTDLIAIDPLLPPTAFVVRRHKHHGEGSRPCECRWIIEAHPQARVFVNDHLTTRESLMFGDTIASGCHRFVFSPADPHPRNCKSNTTVNDLCTALLKEHPLPPGFLKTCPWHRYAQRLRRALVWAGALAVVVLLLFLITPRPPMLEPIQLPIEVTVLADRVELPAPDAVRSIKDVQRQTFTAAAMPEAAVPDKPAPAVADLAAEVRTIDALSIPPPPAPQLAKAPGAIAALTPTELKGVIREPETVKREPVRLASTAPARRLTLKEAAGTSAVELRPVQVQAVVPVVLKALAVAVAAGSGIQAPDSRGLDADKARRLEALAVFKPSPVRFETAGGFQVPVARMSESLAPMESVKAGDYQIDGKVTESEVAKSWKSGRFRLHAPGHPPPEANPATYCYVGRNEVGGKPCLYISFICSDPDTDKIITQVTRNVPYNNFHAPPCILYDDSVEIFLDTNNNRHDYHQMIVNTRGAYWSAYWPSKSDDHKKGQPWDPQATIKTSISKEAGQWVCEILIPFERLGGVPAKGTRWTVNFCRNFRGQREDWQLQSWFEVYDKSRNFHHPDKFGMFEW